MTKVFLSLGQMDVYIGHDLSSLANSSGDQNLKLSLIHSKWLPLLSL